MSTADVTHGEPTCTAGLWAGTGGLASELCVCTHSLSQRAWGRISCAEQWQVGLEDNPGDVC